MSKGDAEYGELLRIAKTVDEVRREIDVQTLQDLFPSDVWVRAFADGAAKLFQKVRSQL